MPLYEIEPGENGKISPVQSTSFISEKIWERRDLQRLLREQIGAIAPGILVIAEEFAEWEESKRRIDLLGVDKDANLVVIELKREDEGGHMELQALRYSAMISPLTFSQVVEVYGDYLRDTKSDEDALQSLLNHLDWETQDSGIFNAKVRIVLASAGFSTEITTTVLWLNNYGLDIRCVRMIPYKHTDRVLIDVQQIIPLPEAADYQVRIQKKIQVEQQAQISNRNSDRFDIAIGNDVYSNLTKGKAMLTLARHFCDCGVTPDEISNAFASFWQWDPAGADRHFWASAEGNLNAENFNAALKAKVEATGKQYKPSKRFTSDGELIHSGNRTYALAKGWMGDDYLKSIEFFRNTFLARSDTEITVTKTERNA